MANPGAVEHEQWASGRLQGNCSMGRISYITCATRLMMRILASAYYRSDHIQHTGFKDFVRTGQAVHTSSAAPSTPKSRRSFGYSKPEPLTIRPSFTRYTYSHWSNTANRVKGCDRGSPRADRLLRVGVGMLEKAQAVRAPNHSREVPMFYKRGCQRLSCDMQHVFA